MIKNFIKYNESVDQLREVNKIKLRDMWEEVEEEIDRIEIIIKNMKNNFQNKILSFETKSNQKINKVKIIGVLIKLWYNENALTISAEFKDENSNIYEIDGKKDIIVWEKVNPADPYGEENWND